MLPGVAQLEMARVAATDAAKSYMDGRTGVRLRNVTWLRGLTVEDAAKTVRIALTLEAEGAMRYVIGSGGSGGEEAVYSEGVAELEELPEREQVKLEAIRGRCGRKVSK
ncbi:hypothetical protein, partial [Paenibacillus peoriae]|uniref:hypothetical protein n=1 Tax=Paenibacillus peoriae TaxID=59893 RepID=UPI0035C6A881